jgi:hypothetical protein
LLFWPIINRSFNPKVPCSRGCLPLREESRRTQLANKRCALSLACRDIARRIFRSFEAGGTIQAVDRCARLTANPSQDNCRIHSLLRAFRLTGDCPNRNRFRAASSVEPPFRRFPRPKPRSVRFLFDVRREVSQGNLLVTRLASSPTTRVVCESIRPGSPSLGCRVRHRPLYISPDRSHLLRSDS